MMRSRQRQLYPPQNFRRKMLNYLGVNNRGMISRPSPGQFTIMHLKTKVGLDRRISSRWLSERMPYYVQKGKNGISFKHFTASDFTADVVAELNAEFQLTER